MYIFDMCRRNDYKYSSKHQRRSMFSLPLYYTIQSATMICNSLFIVGSNPVKRLMNGKNRVCVFAEALYF